MKLTLSLLLSLAMLAPLVSAHEYQHGALTIDHPWSRPTPPGTPMGVGYLSISNGGQAPVILVGASTPRAERVSIHETSMHEGVMRMQPVSGGLTIPAGETVELKPHSFHLMLEQLTAPLQEAERIPLTLRFEGAESITVELNVEPLDSDSHHGKAMDHSGH